MVPTKGQRGRKEGTHRVPVQARHMASWKLEPDLRLERVGLWLSSPRRPCCFLAWFFLSCSDSDPPWFVSGVIVAFIILVLIKHSSDDLLVRHTVDRKCVFPAFPITLSTSCLVFLGRTGVTGDNGILTGRRRLESVAGGGGLDLLHGRVSLQSASQCIYPSPLKQIVPTTFSTDVWVLYGCQVCRVWELQFEKGS